MLEIKCPYCGKRSQNEFTYGGDASIKRPALGKEITDKEWDDFVYFRKKENRQFFEYYNYIDEKIFSNLIFIFYVLSKFICGR